MSGWKGFVRDVAGMLIGYYSGGSGGGSFSSDAVASDAISGGIGSASTSGVTDYGFGSAFDSGGGSALNSTTVTGSSLGSYSPAIGAIGSGVLGYVGQQQTNSANAALAQRQMDFQAGQTGTSYQRAVADMKAAGLNPMLAYSQGGASSGSGASATMQNSLGAGVSSAMAAASTMAQVKQAQAQTDNLDTDSDLKRSNIALNKLMGAKAMQDTDTSAASAAQARALTANAGASLRGITAESQISESNVPKFGNQADMSKTWWGKHVSPYLSDFGQIFHGANQARGAFGR